MRIQRSLSRGLLIMVAILTATSSSAVAKSSAGKNVYGVVDMQAVILNIDEGKQARASLEKEIKSKEKELIKRKKELDQLNKEWKDQSALLSDDARIKRQQQFQEKFMALRNDEMKFQAEIKRKEQIATQKIAVSVSKYVNKLAKSRGYEMVFEANSAGLLYLKDPVDLTKEVIEKFGKDAKPAASAKK